jgi:hypothetical protein
MSDPAFTLFCHECGPQADGATACGSCGRALNRLYHMDVSSSVTVHDAIGLKHRRPGVRKPLLELRQGASRSADGTFAVIEQVVDRVRKVYRKRVVLADGTVSKNVEGSLQDQSLHGAQKPPP